MVLMISYDLNRHEPPSSYEAVREVIEDNAIDSIRPLYSQLFVQTDESPQAWTDRIVRVNQEPLAWRSLLPARDPLSSAQRQDAV
jgi:hypothetical protein